MKNNKIKFLFLGLYLGIASQGTALDQEHINGLNRAIILNIKTILDEDSGKNPEKIDITQLDLPIKMEDIKTLYESLGKENREKVQQKIEETKKFSTDIKNKLDSLNEKREEEQELLHQQLLNFTQKHKE